MKKYLITIPILIIVMTFSGCLLKSGDELLQVPKPTADYLALQNELDKILDTGAVYAAPEDGQNRSTVQLVDIDHDGEDEAISFFGDSVTSGKYTVYVHKKIGNEYIKIGSVSGTGTGILSVQYPVIEDGKYAIAISWRLGNDLGKDITVCELSGGKLITLLDTSYTEHVYADLNNDSVQELVTFSLEKQDRKSARLYSYSNGTMELKSEISLSQDAVSISKVKTGTILGGNIALYVEEKNESGIGLSTDILLMKNNELVNLAAETQQTTEVGTYRPVTVFSRDINGDGITEVPITVTMPGYEIRESGDTVWLLEWYAYSNYTKPQKVGSTFYNVNEDWFLTLPESWVGTVAATKKVDETGNPYTSFDVIENGITKDQVLRIYSFTGEDSRYLTDNFIKLGQRDEVVFAAMIPKNINENYIIYENEIASLFRLITQDWIS